MRRADPLPLGYYCRPSLASVLATPGVPIMPWSAVDDRRTARLPRLSLEVGLVHSKILAAALGLLDGTIDRLD
jgi:hypothetical protein